MDNSGVSREEYNKDIKRIDIKNADQDEKIMELTNGVGSLNALFNNFFIEMPKKVEAIGEAQTSTSRDVQDIKKDIGYMLAADKRREEEEKEKEAAKAKENEERDKKIAANSKRGTIDILKVIADNAWKIVVAVASAMVVANQFLGVPF